MENQKDPMVIECYKYLMSLTSWSKPDTEEGRWAQAERMADNLREKQKAWAEVIDRVELLG